MTMKYLSVVSLLFFLLERTYPIGFENQKEYRHPVLPIGRTSSPDWNLTNTAAFGGGWEVRKEGRGGKSEDR